MITKRSAENLPMKMKQNNVSFHLLQDLQILQTAEGAPFQIRSDSFEAIQTLFFIQVAGSDLLSVHLVASISCLRSYRFRWFL